MGILRNFVNPLHLQTKRNYLERMINEKVNDQDTFEYMEKMFKLSSDIRFESDRFLSEEDAEKKAMEFCKYVKIIIEVYFQNNPV